MNSPVPPVTPAVAKSERRLARWIILALLVMVTPVMVVALGVASMFRLNGEAALLRKEVMTASNSEWNTKVQISAGWCALTTARTILRVVEHEHRDEAQLALAAVRRASVGVYERVGRAGEMSAGRMVTEIDRKMQTRGWSRLVGVMERHETVLVYTSDELETGDKLEICVAVLNGDEMVVVSTKVDAGKLLELASKHLPAEGFRSKLLRETI
ncbi:hypothetical protein ESB00_11690 [Oleiharenicola lentus]|uniref:DUF4252 domain-containing protein n=1 Tax=Oleiharenicola lentus TaxID=2508720 RepID=A0A4Q1CBK6_9BACT|nr:hypothetical protein [Oleiharenicola lentus]RXK56493.1 hypothetical protein ESB00_11690 [Oleiharenicola lentus]